jgi:hypothetical protein
LPRDLSEFRVVVDDNIDAADMLAAARLREIPKLNSIILVAVTGYGQESDRRKTTPDFITTS